MTSSASGALAVELHPSAPSYWIATYYPMVATPAGRWADVTWALHQALLPTTDHARDRARWLEVRSSDLDHPCHVGHQGWATELAADYIAALAVYHAAATEEPLTPQETQQMRAGTVVVPAGQLAEWVLDDLEEETSDVHS